MADYKIVYAVVERLGKRHWLRIGMAFVNRDGSLNVKLDALPLNGQLQIRSETARSGPLDEATAPAQPRPHTKEAP